MARPSLETDRIKATVELKIQEIKHFTIIDRFLVNVMNFYMNESSLNISKSLYSSICFSILALILSATILMADPSDCLSPSYFCKLSFFNLLNSWSYCKPQLSVCRWQYACILIIKQRIKLCTLGTWWDRIMLSDTYRLRL